MAASGIKAPLFFALLLLLFLSASNVTAFADPPPPPPAPKWSIRDDAYGGDCGAIGNWDAASKTCTLTADLTTDQAGILIGAAGLTLDGNGKTLTSTGSRSAIGTGPSYGLSDVTIRNLRLVGFGQAIYAENNQKASISGNHIADSNTAIYLLRDSGVVLRDNTIENCSSGISLLESLQGTVSGNLMNNNTVGMYLPSDASTTIDTTNLINGRPVWYVTNASGQTFDSSTNAAIFGCVNCSNVTIRDLNLSGGGEGLMLWNTSDSRVENITATSNGTGVSLGGWSGSHGNIVEGIDATSNSTGLSLFRANENVIRNSNFSENSNRGLMIQEGNRNIISGSTFDTNNAAGIEIRNSDWNKVDQNDTSSNGPASIYGSGLVLSSGSDHNTLSGNTADRNSFYGISIEGGSYGNVLRGNSVSGNRANFHLGTPDQDIDTSNLVEGKLIYNVKKASGQTFDATSNAGFFSCWQCDSVVVRDLELAPNETGLHLLETTNSLFENVKSEGSIYPVVLSSSTNNTLIGGSAGSGYFAGITMSASPGNRIFGSYIHDNQSAGIVLSDSSDNTVAGSDISGNAVGISSSGTASGNVFFDNTLAPASRETINLYSGANTFYNNNFYISDPERPYRVTSPNIFNRPLPAGGNFWSTYNTPEQGCLDADVDHICDDSLVVDLTNQYGTHTQFTDDYPWNIPDGWHHSDTDAPWVGHVLPGGSIIGSPDSISASFYDSVSGVDTESVRLDIDGAELHDCTATATGVSCPVGELGYGVHKISGSVADTAGNTAPISGTFSRSRSYFFSWYDNNGSWGMNGDWICVANLDASAADVDIYIGQDPEPVESFQLSSAGSEGDHREWKSRLMITDGPVRIVARDGQELIVSQRTIFKESFNETMALGEDRLDSEYYFSWYDNNRAWGMNGDWICVTNLGTEPTTVNIYIGDSDSPAAALALEPGRHGEWQAKETVVGGPVRVVSDNGQPVMASQRVIYRESFTEIFGTRRSVLTDEAYLTWYDNNRSWGMNGGWICVANAGDLETQVSIQVGPQATPRFQKNLAPGEHVEWSSPGVLTDGPVRVSSTEGQPLVVSQRSIYKSSMEEVQGTYPSEISNMALFPWYDSKGSNGMKGNWIMVANPNDREIDFELSIGNTMMNNGPAGHRFHIPANSVKPTSFSDLMNGPVAVIGPAFTIDPVPSFLASQRVIYGDSFNEIIGAHRLHSAPRAGT